MKAKFVASILFAVATLFAAPAGADRQLRIQPTIQLTEVWCWAAVSEMVLRYFGYRSLNPAGIYQCGVVAMLGGICDIQCGMCRTGIGSTHNMSAILLQYQNVARYRGVAGRSFTPRPVAALSAVAIINEIGAGRPVVAGISPSGMGYHYPPGFGEHVALIVGYRRQGGDVHLIVNDPYPFSAIGYDPYLLAGGRLLVPGQYLISYSMFISRLNYKDSIILSL